MECHVLVMTFLLFCDSINGVLTRNSPSGKSGRFARQKGLFHKGPNSHLTDDSYQAALPALTVTPTEPFPRWAQLDESGDMVLFWRCNASHLVLEVHARTWGYVGVGISRSGAMFPADIMMAWVRDDGTVHFSDRYAARGHYEPVVDLSQDWRLVRALETDKGTVVQAARRLDTFDADQDVRIDKGPVHVIFAFHSDDPLYDTGLPHHGAGRRGMRTLELIESSSLENDALVLSANETLAFRRGLLQRIGRHENSMAAELEDIKEQVLRLRNSSLHLISDLDRHDFRLSRAIRVDVAEPLGRVSSDVTTVSRNVDTLSEQVTSQGNSTHSFIQALDRNVMNAASTLAANITYTINDLEERLSANVARVDGRLQRLLSGLDKLESFKTEVRTALEDFAVSLTNLRSDVGQMKSRLESVENVSNVLTSSVARDVDRMTSRLTSLENTSSMVNAQMQSKLVETSETLHVVDAATASLQNVVTSEVLPQLGLTNTRMETLMSDVDGNHRTTQRKMDRLEAAQNELHSLVTQFNASIEQSMQELDRRVLVMSVRLDAVSGDVATLGGRLDNLGVDLTVAFARVNSRVATNVFKLDQLGESVAEGQRDTNVSILGLQDDVKRNAISLSLLNEGSAVTVRALEGVRETVQAQAKATEARLLELAEDFHRSNAESGVQLATLGTDVATLKLQVDSMTVDHSNMTARLEDLTEVLATHSLTSLSRLDTVATTIDQARSLLQGDFRSQGKQLAQLITSAADDLDIQIKNVTLSQVVLTSRMDDLQSSSEVKVVRLVHTADARRYDRFPHARVELFVDRQWHPVCHGHFRKEEANVVCRHLGYPDNYVSVMSSSGHVTSRARPGIKLECLGFEREVTQCQWSKVTCQDSNEQLLACFGGSKISSTEPLVRLVNGSSPWEGRVEVLYKDQWGTVCDDHFNDRVAARVCHSLGFHGGVATALGNAHFGQGTGPIWMDDVVCKDWTWSLADCYHMDWGVTNCSHEEDAGVRCWTGDGPLPEPPKLCSPPPARRLRVCQTGGEQCMLWCVMDCDAQKSSKSCQKSSSSANSWKTFANYSCLPVKKI